MESLFINGIQFSYKSLSRSLWWNFGKFNVNLKDFYTGLRSVVDSIKEGKELDLERGKWTKCNRLGITKHMVLESVNGIEYPITLDENTRVTYHSGIK